jgi:hypothetical protein
MFIVPHMEAYTGRYSDVALHKWIVARAVSFAGDEELTFDNSEGRVSQLAPAGLLSVPSCGRTPQSGYIHKTQFMTMDNLA